MVCGSWTSDTLILVVHEQTNFCKDGWLDMVFYSLPFPLHHTYTPFLSRLFFPQHSLKHGKESILPSCFLSLSLSLSRALSPPSVSLSFSPHRAISKLAWQANSFQKISWVKPLGFTWLLLTVKLYCRRLSPALVLTTVPSTHTFSFPLSLTAFSAATVVLFPSITRGLSRTTTRTQDFVKVTL